MPWRLAHLHFVHLGGLIEVEPILQWPCSAAILCWRHENPLDGVRVEHEKIPVMVLIHHEVFFRYTIRAQELGRFREHERLHMYRRSLILYDLVWSRD